MAGYFDALLSLVEHMIGEGFVKPKHRGLFVTAEHPPALLDALQRHQMPATRRWLSGDET